MTENPTPTAETQTGRTGSRRLHRLLATLLLGLAVAVGSTALAAPAQAARDIAGPSGFYCDSSTARIAVAPPRIWATYGTEQVLWVTGIERWNPSTQRWYSYSTFQDWSSYDYFGRSVTSWGPKYTNNYMRYPVYHKGYYRVASAIGGNQGGVTWNGYVAGGNYCQIF
jgi:hypothetical protein